MYQMVTALSANAITTRRDVIKKLETVLGFVKIIPPGDIVSNVKMAPMVMLPSSNVKVSDGTEFLDIACPKTLSNAEANCS